MNKLKERKDRVEKALHITKLLIILVIFVVLLPIFLTEMYLKSIGLGDPIRYTANAVYGYSPTESQTKIRFKKSKIQINESGLRMDVNWKNNKRKKILFFGDSVTYGGSYIDDKEIFTYRACHAKILRAYAGDLDKFNNNLLCGNAGVNSYGIFNIVFRSRYDERIQDAEIIIFILVGDDFYRGLQKADTAHFYLNNKKFPFPAVTEAINFIATKYDINNYIAKSLNYESNNKKELVSESINLLQSEIMRLENTNKKVFLFYSPTIDKDGKINLESEYVYGELKRKINKNIISLYKILSKEMFVDSVHYNKLGHERVGNVIGEVLFNFLETK